MESLPNVSAAGSVVNFRRQFHLLVTERAAHHYCIHTGPSHHARESMAEVVPAANLHSNRRRCRMEGGAV
jgi:hypothetical protein